jgi:hypothetical protein
VILEYAEGGDLGSFFERAPRITSTKALGIFWTNFFSLLNGLDVIHNLTPPNENDEWLLKR